MSTAIPTLPPAVAATQHAIAGPAGRLGYYAAGPAGTRPLLLIHSINAAGSAYEVRPLFEHYAGRRAVYAVDLPGFGISAREDRPYDPRLMTDAIHAMVARIRADHAAVPIDALAVSLGCEFLARAADETPEAFRGLALVSPTGFGGDDPRDGPPGSTRGRLGLHRILALPLWGHALFRLLTSRPSIRYFLRKTWGGPDIDEGLAAYDWLTARQPGAMHAPYRFVSGFLFSGDIGRIYRRLAHPVWMAHGVRGDFTDYRGKRAVEGKANWTIAVLQTGALPHFEMLGPFTQGYDAFLARLDGEDAPPRQPGEA